MNKVYKIIKPIMLVIIVLLGVIALLSIYNAGYKQLTNSDYAFLFDYSSHEVNEENMAPDYNRGDLAIIKRDYIYTEGDTIIYNYKNSYRIGIITEHIAGKYSVKDNINSVDNDYEITDNLVIGKVVSKVKGFANIYKVITSTYMMIAIIIFIGGYFFLTATDRPKSDI